MSTEDNYRQLGERKARLGERRAVLVAREADRAEERERLAKELRAAGVNPDDPDAEIVRLTKTIEDEYQKASQALDEFEKDLLAAEAGKLPAVPPVPTPKPTAPPAPAIESLTVPPQKSAPTKEPAEDLADLDIG